MNAKEQEYEREIVNDYIDNEASERRKQCIDFVHRLRGQRLIQELPMLHNHDLEQYCQVLINGASVFHLLATMQCSDRIDLVDSDDSGSNPACDALEQKFQMFTKQYLGLTLLTSGDPRGAVWKIKCDPSLGNGWEHDAIIVPSSDSAYFSF